jgi:hypothetical protein
MGRRGNALTITVSAIAPGVTGFVECFILSRTDFQLETRHTEQILHGEVQSITTETLPAANIG